MIDQCCIVMIDQCGIPKPRLSRPIRHTGTKIEKSCCRCPGEVKSLSLSLSYPVKGQGAGLAGHWQVVQVEPRHCPPAGPAYPAAAPNSLSIAALQVIQNLSLRLVMVPGHATSIHKPSGFLAGYEFKFIMV
jgi:hypothetical protein